MERWIDADALREVLETEVQVNPITQQYNKEDVIRAIMDAPTIAHGTDSITIKWTPDLDKLARDVAFRGLNEFSFLGKSIREWVEIILEHPSWISVKERLPNKGQIVIASDGEHTWDVGMYKSFCGKPSEWNWKKNTMKTVLWWMPKDGALPEPPKEVKQND